MVRLLLVVLHLGLIGGVAAADQLAQGYYAERWGAIAREMDGDGGYGVAHSYSTPDAARARALRECGRGCRIIVEFTTCAAYAVDESRGGTAWGWGRGNSRRQAEQVALSECAARGRYCALRASLCNGS